MLTWPARAARLCRAIEDKDKNEDEAELDLSPSARHPNIPTFQHANPMKSLFRPRTWLLCLVASVLATGLAAIIGFQQIRALSATEGRDAGRLRAAARSMLQALSDMEAAHTARDGEPEAPNANGALNSRQRFADELEGLVGLTPARREVVLIEDLVNGWDEHRELLKQIATDGHERGPQSVATPEHQKLFSSYRRLSQTVLELRRLAEDRTGGLGTPIDQTATRYALVVACLTALGLFASLWVGHGLATSIVAPIQRASRFIDRALQGELHLRLPREEPATLNKLVLSCNRLIEDLQEVTEEGRRRIRSERVLALALIESFDAPTAAVTPAGDVLLSNSSARNILTGDDSDSTIKQLRDCVTKGHDQLSCETGTFRVELLSPTATRSSDVLLIHLHAER